MPKVSIITPCYNCDRYIGKTIESVRSQTFADWEHIVVDDGSRDNSAQVVRSYLSGDPRLRLIQQSNQGVASARLSGVNASSKDSDYLLFLDADDCLDPEMLSVLAEYLNQHPKVGLAYCHYHYIDDSDAIIETPYFPRFAPSRFGVHELTDEEPITPFVSVFMPAVILPSISLIRRAIYDRTPGWDQAFGQPCEDTDLFLHIALHSQVHFVPQKLVRYRRHDHQSTTNSERYAQQQQKLYQKWRHLESLTAEQKALVKAAWRFRQGRVTPHKGLEAGTRHLKQGEVRQSLRFYGGALRRYAGSFLPELMKEADS
ncbi:glycosyltransferase family 2 protein [Phormidesmis priestleyi ULC007]|uniref:Glycosyltransferase family 2 protein n=1 Tax=Phormidesmis priestleyi ULC007 TaxID=1920490 RepID=A0A2T1DNJ2_9CYAN|nr:glycosyltransferase family A protein [Phormidesmis priestleyi]PSB22025.1 glycosyltransferase family 2 protein [Phormidesmis priestleyi ULC007]PZO55007.1 MAG: glycosyltransferase family 2 protein [Phormidesmis priestleyi]